MLHQHQQYFFIPFKGGQLVLCCISANIKYFFISFSEGGGGGALQARCKVLVTQGTDAHFPLLSVLAVMYTGSAFTFAMPATNPPKWWQQRKQSPSQ